MRRAAQSRQDRLQAHSGQAPRSGTISWSSTQRTDLDGVPLLRRGNRSRIGVRQARLLSEGPSPRPETSPETTNLMLPTCSRTSPWPASPAQTTRSYTCRRATNASTRRNRLPRQLPFGAPIRTLPRRCSDQILRTIFTSLAGSLLSWQADSSPAYTWAGQFRRQLAGRAESGCAGPSRVVGRAAITVL